MDKTTIEFTREELQELSTVLFLFGTGRAGTADEEKSARKINERVQRKMNWMHEETR